MAKIKDAYPKKSSGGYDRVFDNKEVGYLVQRIQSTVISNGNELEKMIIEGSQKIENLDDWLYDLKNNKIANGTYLCPKSVIKRSRYNMEKHEPDMAVFQVSPTEKNCMVIELKDGDSFDTKKADGEHDALEKFCTYLGQKIPFITNFYICCFNQPEKEEIVSGLKSKFSIDEVMTGKELCDLLGIDYAEIIEKRKEMSKENLDFFVSELINIPIIKIKLSEKRKAKISEEEFYTEEIDN